MYGFRINRDLSLSYEKQLENQLRSAILSGRLKAGTRIFPTRSMAKELGIARNTVIQVYEQLTAEGYLKCIRGSGTYVADIGSLPDFREIVFYEKNDKKQQTGSPKAKNENISFSAGNPDIGAFSRIQWAKILKTACLEEDNYSLTYGNYAGIPELRKAIRSYVYRMKGMLCDEEQIVIIPGISGGLDILAKALERKHNRIAMEDPCMDFVKNVFSGAGYEICPVEVGAQGMDIKKLRDIDGVDLIYVVPSHQFPIGSVLNAASRIALLNYANEQSAYVLEDDYDSEFRYKGEVLQALWNLSPEHVIFLGSFSKIFLPSLRLGYMILPKHLCDMLIKQMDVTNLWVNSTLQLAMAEFINQMLLDKHIFKMKKLYVKKRLFTINCLENAFGDRVKITGEYAGLHLLASLDRDLTDSDLQRIRESGIIIDHVEDFAILKGKHKNQLVFGYGGLSLQQIEEGIKRIKTVIDENKASE